ncbi:MAG: hypothetical protein KUG75_13095, partial [Pseudomonadales bacterium]|nr:hypothetical protein [Pseudomonadales bacterium]
PLLAEVVGAAWNGTAIYDLMHEGTEGVRADDFPQRKAAFIATQLLAEEDAEIRHKRLLIGNMLESPSILFTEDFLLRLQDKMAMLDTQNE